MKPTPTPAQILVRTSKDNRDWLRAKAQEQERSVNWLIHKILENARLLDAEGKYANAA